MNHSQLLQIEQLSVTFGVGERAFKAVDDVSVSLTQGEILAIVGESGSGKSVAMMALMGLLPDSAHVQAKQLTFNGHNLQTISAAERRHIIGKDISMIFQDEPCESRSAAAPRWQPTIFPRIGPGIRREQPGWLERSRHWQKNALNRRRKRAWLQPTGWPL